MNWIVRKAQYARLHGASADLMGHDDRVSSNQSINQSVSIPASCRFFLASSMAIFRPTTMNRLVRVSMNSALPCK